MTDAYACLLGQHGSTALEAIRLRCPEVAQKLISAVESWSPDAKPETCQALGLSSRDACILYAQTIYSPDFPPLPKKDPPKKGDANGLIAVTMQALKRFTESESQRDFCKATWSYAMAVQHDVVSTPDEALAALAATTFALYEVEKVVRNAESADERYKRFGIYKCPQCGGTDLDLYEDGEYSDYDSWHVEFPICNKCQWQGQP